MSDSSDEEQPQPKRKRGIVHPESYKRNIVCVSRVKGDGYVSYKVKSPKNPFRKICHANVQANVILS